MWEVSNKAFLFFKNDVFLITKQFYIAVTLAATLEESSMSVQKTIAEINEKIRQGKAVTLTADEMTSLVKEKGAEQAAIEVDVVTTGTFSPMCSSGMFFNIGQTVAPTIRVTKMWLNDVPCYSGVAAVDAFLGATEMKEGDPLNKVYPGDFSYGGAHVIEDLLLGKKVTLRCESYTTDCYPNKGFEKEITLADLKYAHMLNPRNCYQNYNVAVNISDKIKYTYMGPLKSNMQNCNFATAGKLSPLFNDPYLKTIGLGTRIFLGGGTGFVLGAGTQHVVAPQRNSKGIPLSPSGTLMLKGDLKNMDARYIRGNSFYGYGVTLSVGVGIPIPILNAEMATFTAVDDCDIEMPVKDYSSDYQNMNPRVLKHVTYEELRKGSIEIEGKTVSAHPLTSYAMSLEIAQKLKEWIDNGQFFLTEPVEEIESR